MKCLRCGYCCINYDVIIVNKEYANKNISSIKDLPADAFEHKESGVACPHLVIINGKSTCVIHDKTWYRQTPCFDFTQVERGDQNCRMGEYLLKDMNLKGIKKLRFSLE